MLDLKILFISVLVILGPLLQFFHSKYGEVSFS